MFWNLKEVTWGPGEMTSGFMIVIWGLRGVTWSAREVTRGVWNVTKGLRKMNGVSEK